MNILFLCLPPFLAAAKVTVQGAFSRKRTKTLSDILLYNVFVVLFAAAVVAAMFVRAVPSPAVWGYAAISGVLVILFQCSYTKAFKCGSVALTVIINSFNIVFSLVAGALFFDEKWTILGGVGAACMAAAFYLIPERSGETKKINGKWLFFTLLAFTASGLNNVLTLFISKGAYAGENSAYIALSNAYACVFLIPTYFIVKKKERAKEEKGLMKADGVTFGVTFVAGALVGLYNYVVTLGLKVWESFVYMPVINGAMIVIVLLLNFALYKEKPSVRSLIGVVLAVAAVVLLNIK